jgi:hypothetical protein
MRRFIALFSGILLAAVPLTAEAGPRRDEPRTVRDNLRDGGRTLEEIERKVLPTMGGMEYLGPEYDAATRVYRLKFIRNGRVVFVDVDARSGEILHQSR